MDSSANTQQRRRALGLCILCQAPAKGVYCEPHRRQANVYQRERKRKVLGCKRRNINAESYTFTEQRGRSE